MGRRRNKSYTKIPIIGMSSEGMGIARIENKVIFVEKAVPGDVADIITAHRKKGFDFARIENLVEASSDRIDPFCKHFGICGGCKWQYLPYEKQLEHKTQIVKDAFRRIGAFEGLDFQPIVGAASDRDYRNKLEFTFSNNRWITQDEIDRDEVDQNRNGLGFHIPKYFDRVVDVDTCHLMDQPSNSIKNSIRKFSIENDLSFYDIRNKEGLLRNLFVRQSTLGQVLVLVSASEPCDELTALLTHILDNHPEVTSLNYVINNKRNDTIFDLPIHHFAGEEFILEKIGDYQFRIGPKSFFQTNSKQAEVLYNIVRDFADLKGDEVVYDLYTGVGSIAIYLSKLAKKVIGLELIEEAIADAKLNAELNQVTNCEFHVGDVKDSLSAGFFDSHGSPDLLIVDPPRAGLHPDVIGVLNKSEIQRIVYVSCNPATQARDLRLMDEHYQIEKIQPVDMFPQTVHIENVVLLQRK